MVQGGTYRIRNRKSGTYLDESNNDPNTVHGWESRPQNDNQKWELEDAGNGGFRLRNVGHSDRYLATSGPHDNAAVKASSSDRDVWTFKEKDGGYIIYLQGSNHCVDLDYGKKENNTRVSVWGFTGAQQQIWELEEVGGGHRGGQYSGQQQQQWQQQPQQQQQQQWQQQPQYRGAVQPGTYRVNNVFTNTRLDLAGGGAKDGTPVIAWSAGAGSNQTWTLESGTNGYRFRNGASGTYLGYNNLEQGELLVGRGQPLEWTVSQADQGYQIHPAQNQNLVVDLAEGKRDDGAKICLWPNNNSANQKWNFSA